MDSIYGPLETPRTITDYRIEGFKVIHNLAPITPEETSLSDNEYNFFIVCYTIIYGIVWIKYKKILYIFMLADFVKNCWMNIFFLVEIMSGIK